MLVSFSLGSVQLIPNSVPHSMEKEQPPVTCWIWTWLMVIGLLLNDLVYFVTVLCDEFIHCYELAVFEMSPDNDYLYYSDMSA